MHTEAATIAPVTFASLMQALGYPRNNRDAIAIVEAALPGVTGEVVELGFNRRQVVYTGPVRQSYVEHAQNGVQVHGHAYAALRAAGITA